MSRFLRRAERRHLDLEFVDQHRFDIEILAARGALRELQFFSRDDGFGHQPVILVAHLRHRALALAERDRERLAQLHDALLHDRRERLPSPGVDDLNDTDQLLGLAIDDGRHQHLLGAVAGLGVDRLEEIQLRAVGLEFNVVVHVADVDDPLVDRDEAGDRLLADRQLDVLERIEAGLHLGDDRTPVVAQLIDRQTVGMEQAAPVLRELQDDLVDILRRVNLVGDRLQLLLETQLLRQVFLGDRLVLKYRTHCDLASFNSPPVKIVGTPIVS